MDKLRTLAQFQQHRLDQSLVYIRKHPVLMLFLNLYLVGINNLVNIRSRMRTAISDIKKLATVGQIGKLHTRSLPFIDITRNIPTHPSILLVVENSIPQCFRYRVSQKVEQLELAGYRTSVSPWTDYVASRQKLHFCHIVIFYRVPAYPEVVKTIEYAKRLNKIVIYDIDDFVFDRDCIAKLVLEYDKQLSRQEQRGLVEGAGRYRNAMLMCRYGIASTPILAKEVNKIMGDGKVYVHRNGLDSWIGHYLKGKRSEFKRNYLTIFYGSGTKTHDPDFKIVASALGRILEERDDVRITLVGYLALPEELNQYKTRIDKVPVLEFEPYMELLSRADISIAPLRLGLFADCKSEIKWLEAAVFGIPAVVSATGNYTDILNDGRDVMIVGDEDGWYEKLSALLDSPRLRRRIGMQAQEKAKKNYNPTVLTANLESIINDIINHERKRGTVACLGKEPAQLLYVDASYPPQTPTGASVCIDNMVSEIKKTYSSRYNISVFTCEINDGSAYELSEYIWNGVNVAKINLPAKEDIESDYKNDRIYETFRRYLEFIQPDIVHFHRIEKLSASALKAAEDKDIPYIVTVYDAWWISDNQYMLDSEGMECDYIQVDPLVVARCSNDVNKTIQRRRYLVERLGNASTLLAVSERMTDFYRKNGFSEIQVSRIGVAQQIRSIDDQVAELESIYSSIILGSKGNRKRLVNVGKLY